jgi:UDP-N-acetylglucosamine:LPS N-acetylglucosamine transferase
LRRGFKRHILETRPDIVVSVLPVVNGLLAEAARHVNARLEVVLTDWHSVHRFWVGRAVDHYTAPTDSARLDCIRFGAPPASVDVVGIPVRSEFTAAAEVDRESVRARLSDLGMDRRKFTILAMVGAEGSPRALSNIQRLAQLDLAAQMLVICGHNVDLRRRVEGMTARLPLRALGFVDNVAELMRASDVLVTKAGGVTLAEAFCCQMPVVVHDVLPGQEAGNLEYVRGQAAVLFAPDPPALARIIQDLMQGPQRRAALAERGARLARPTASHDIARGVLGRAGL